MKLFRKGSRLSAILLCSILMLGGCGKGGSDSGSGQAHNSLEGAISETEQLMAYKDMRYLPEFTDISQDYSAFASVGIAFLNDTFYLMKREMSGYSITGGQLVAYRPDSGEEMVLLDGADLEERLVTAAPLEDGAIIVLSETRDGGYRLRKLGPQGDEIFSREYSELAVSEGALEVEFVADSKGRSYLEGQKCLILFDEQGKAAGNIDLSGKSISKIACDGNGKVYLYDLYKNQLTPVDFEAASLGTDSYPLPVSIVRVIAATDKADFLICDETTVYQYNLEGGEVTPLFDLQDSQIANAYYLDVMGEMKDGRLFLFSRDQAQDIMEIALLAPTPLAECPVKEVVTIGTVYPYTSLLDSVAKFNRKNEDFSVSILNYRIEGRNWQEAQAALKLDYSIGKGPDICLLDGLDDSEVLYASGCFADLSPWLEESQQYKKEDFISQSLEVFAWQGHLMAIPKYFALETIVGKPGIVGTGAGWDLDDLKAVIQAHPDAMIFEDRSSSYMLNVCIRNMLDEFVDFDRNKADFDSEKYVDFLNFLKSLPDNYEDSIENGYWVHMYRWLREENALLSCSEIHDITDFQVLEAAFGGAYTCIGYPSPDKAPDCIITGSSAYAISSVSPNQDRAWRFIEWCLSTQGEESGMDLNLRTGFPTRIDVFEREMEEAVNETRNRGQRGGVYFSDGTGVEFRKTTQEEVELLYSLIEMASPERNAEKTILEIMEEEAVYLYDGSKTAEDVAKVTQNRVQLYLNENDR